MKHILVTGGAGFVGSNFLHHYLEKNKDCHIINLDKLTYAASTKNLAQLPADRHTLVRGDICDALLLKDIFSARKIEGIINFAAESPVKNSVIPPYQFVKTNIEGTFTLLEEARKTWLETPYNYKPEYRQARFVQVSTTDVYGALADTKLSKESDPYEPASPFSASKASADLLVQSYNKTYGLNTLVANTSTCYGPFQYDDKLIPTIIRNALFGQPIPVYGDGKNIRDWMYVEDCCAAIGLIFQKGKSGERYNVSADNEMSNVDLVKKVCKIMDDIMPNITGKPYAEQIIYTADPGGSSEAKHYGADNSKLKYQLEWKLGANFDKTLKNTVLFYIDKYKNI